VLPFFGLTQLKLLINPDDFFGRPVLINRRVDLGLTRRPARRTACPAGAEQIELYTILPLPILYGVWHTKEGPGGDRRLRESRAIVSAIVWAMQVGGNTRRIDLCTKASK